MTSYLAFLPRWALLAVAAGLSRVRPSYLRCRTRADAERWIAWNKQNYTQHGHGLWVIETRDGHFIGDCGLTVQDIEGDRFVEVGYHVHLALRSLATEAATSVREAARAEGVPYLVAIIRPSQRVAEKTGLRLERRVHRNGGDTLVFGSLLLLGVSLLVTPVAGSAELSAPGQRRVTVPLSATSPTLTASTIVVDVLTNGPVVERGQRGADPGQARHGGTQSDHPLLAMAAPTVEELTDEISGSAGPRSSVKPTLWEVQHGTGT